MPNLRANPQICEAIAHHLNNELTIILSAQAQALAQTRVTDPARRWLLEARDATERCMGAMSGLLGYGQRHGARPSPHGIETALEEKE